MKNETLVKDIFDKLVEQYGLTNVVIGILLGAGTGILTSASYLIVLNNKEGK